MASCVLRRLGRGWLAPWLLLLAVCLTMRADNWPQFRGPHGNGAADGTGYPARIDPARSVAWKVALPGRGLSSPIIVGDRVFVTCSSGPRQQRLHVLCFNVADGTLRWEQQLWATGRTMCHEKTSVAAPTPVSDGTRVYASFSSNDVVCFDLDGNLVWLRGLMLDYPNASNSLGMASSLAVAAGTLVAQIENDSESLVVGIDLETGTNRWKLDRPKKANWSTPVVFQDPDGRWLAGVQSASGFVALEPTTGRTVWHHSEPASTVPSATPGDGVLYVVSRGLTALRVPQGDGPPAELWRSSQLRPSTASPVATARWVCALNDAGVLTGGDPASGQRRWQLRLKGPFSASPVAAGELLYAVNEAGLLQIVDLDAPEPVVTAEYDLGQTILGTPALSGGAVYVRSDGWLWKLVDGSDVSKEGS